MAVLPTSLALTSIGDGSPIVAVDHRNNYAAIQADVNALIAILANGNGVDGDAMVWDATNAKWAAASTLASTRPRAPRIVTSTMAGGPPGSPLDGDIWVATSVDANGARWTFQYNAGSASAFKWEFVGGSPLSGEIATSQGITSAAYVDAATVGPTLTLPRAGDYLVSFGVTFLNGASTLLAYAAVKRGAAATSDADSAQASLNTSGSAGDTETPTRWLGALGVAANDVYKLQYKSTNGAATVTVSNRWLTAVPKRIS